MGLEAQGTQDMVTAAVSESVVLPFLCHTSLVLFACSLLSPHLLNHGSRLAPSTCGVQDSSEQGRQEACPQAERCSTGEERL